VQSSIVNRQSSIVNRQSSIVNRQSSASSVKSFTGLSNSKKALAAAMLLATGHVANAATATFDFSTLTTSQSSYTQTVSGVTITLSNPKCEDSTATLNAQNFLTDTNGLSLEPPTDGSSNGCGGGPTLDPSQFDISFNQTVQFASYVTTAWDAGNYDLVVGSSPVSMSNTVGTSITSSSSYPFVSTPTLAVGTIATLKMVGDPANNDGGQLKSVTINYTPPPVSASIFNFDKPAVTYGTEIIGAE
jgi:hypothetical protein